MQKLWTNRTSKTQLLIAAVQMVLTLAPWVGDVLVVYCAEVTRLDNNKSEFYTGLTGGKFKDRYNQHQCDFRHEKNQNSTCLSKYVWSLKHEQIPYKIDWKILCRGRIFSPVTRTCRLCLMEKYFISFHPETATLNQRSELYSTCRHRKGKLLEKFKP